MGFLKNTSTIELNAKLTPQGRRKLVTNNNTLITSFALGDSDAFYSVFSGLTNGQVPAVSGDFNGNDVNNGGINYNIKSVVNYKVTTLRKPVEVQSISVNTSFQNLGFTNFEISGGSLTQQFVDLNDKNTDPFVNLFYSFSLPISNSNFTKFTGTTVQNGGFSNTALSGLAKTKIIVLSIDSDEYSELIDGKTLKLDIATTGQTYNLYSTYEKKGISLINEDSSVVDSSPNLTQFGPNRVLLFSDQIKRPNGNPALSWSTGYGQNKPFSVSAKQLYNFRDNANVFVRIKT